MFLDEIVQEWFNRITNTGGPGAANRCGEILRAMFNKAEQWGVRPEGSTPCLYIRKSKGRKCERFLSNQEFKRIGIAVEPNLIGRLCLFSPPTPITGSG